MRLYMVVLHAPFPGWGWLFLAASVSFFGFNVWAAVFRGRTYYGPFKYSRESDPVTYWYLTVIYAASGLFSAGVLLTLAYAALT